ncbi:MAG: hypothetical protein KKH51_12785 [Actinobacteria bacterium]|nr:hypothetical protein [Actinomycetota bacterium]
MTTFHEPQPQSRRAVRQSERGDGSEPQFSATSDDMWDTTSRRAAQLPPVSTLPEEPAPGRRSATPSAPLPEPLNYSTQSRPAMPSYDGPSFRSRGSAAPQPVPYDTAAQPPTQAIEQQGQFRPRDFSPGAATNSPWSQPAPTAPVTPASDLDYQTEARFRAAAAAAPLAPISEVPASVAPINKLWAPPEPVAAPEPARVVPANSDFPLEQTFTRRELRAMQQAEEAAALVSQQPQSAQPQAVRPQVAPPQAAAAPPALQTQQPVAQPDPILQSQAPVASAPSAFPLVEPRVGQPPALPPVSSTPAPAAPPAFVPQAAAPVASSPFESLFTPAEAPAQQAPVAQVPAEIAPAPVVDEVSPWTPPTGHWSTQLDVEDDEIETTISRRIGSGSTTTSALVLPTIPNGTDIRGPLTSTGEIMLTGSIDLPRNLAATGQSDRYDGGGIDDLFDLQDHEIISTDSSPVRAIRAVSTHTSGHGVTHTQKPKGTRALTALLIAASSMAVVVAGLLVAAFAFNVF